MKMNVSMVLTLAAMAAVAGCENNGMPPAPGAQGTPIGMAPQVYARGPATQEVGSINGYPETVINLPLSNTTLGAVDAVSELQAMGAMPRLDEPASTQGMEPGTAIPPVGGGMVGGATGGAVGGVVGDATGGGVAPGTGVPATGPVGVAATEGAAAATEGAATEYYVGPGVSTYTPWYAPQPYYIPEPIYIEAPQPYYVPYPVYEPVYGYYPCYPWFSIGWWGGGGHDGHDHNGHDGHDGHDGHGDHGRPGIGTPPSHPPVVVVPKPTPPNGAHPPVNPIVKRGETVGVPRNVVNIGNPPLQAVHGTPVQPTRSLQIQGRPVSAGALQSVPRVTGAPAGGTNAVRTGNAIKSGAPGSSVVSMPRPVTTPMPGVSAPKPAAAQGAVVSTPKPTGVPAPRVSLPPAPVVMRSNAPQKLPTITRGDAAPIPEAVSMPRVYTPPPRSIPQPMPTPAPVVMRAPEPVMRSAPAPMPMPAPVAVQASAPRASAPPPPPPAAPVRSSPPPSSSQDGGARFNMPSKLPSIGR